MEDDEELSGLGCVAGGYVMLVVLLFVPLGMLAVFSSVKVIYDAEILWIIYIVMSGLFSICAGIPILLWGRESVIDFLKALLAIVFIVGVGGLVMNYAIVYEAGPILLHHITSRKGTKVVQVVGKSERSNRACTRIYIKEFTAPLSNYLCITREEFREIRIGDRYKLHGSVSKYGVDVKSKRKYK